MSNETTKFTNKYLINMHPVWTPSISIVAAIILSFMISFLIGLESKFDIIMLYLTIILTLFTWLLIYIEIDKKEH
jgi:hypothetical protein